MSAVEFEPAPILHPNHKSRTMRAVICPICRRAFRPWGASTGYFCTTRCAGRARSLGLRMTKDGRTFAPAPPPYRLTRADYEEVVAQCTAALEKARGLLEGKP